MLEPATRSRNGTRHEHLVRPSERDHARADVDRHAADVVTEELELAGVDPAPSISAL
jgi:hypothetical protein